MGADLLREGEQGFLTSPPGGGGISPLLAKKKAALKKKGVLGATAVTTASVSQKDLHAALNNAGPALKSEADFIAAMEKTLAKKLTKKQMQELDKSVMDEYAKVQKAQADAAMLPVYKASDGLIHPIPTSFTDQWVSGAYAPETLAVKALDEYVICGGLLPAFDEWRGLLASALFGVQTQGADWLALEPLPPSYSMMAKCEPFWTKLAEAKSLHGFLQEVLWAGETALAEFKATGQGLVAYTHQVLLGSAAWAKTHQGSWQDIPFQLILAYIDMVLAGRKVSLKSCFNLAGVEPLPLNVGPHPKTEPELRQVLWQATQDGKPEVAAYALYHFINSIHEGDSYPHFLEPKFRDKWLNAVSTMTHGKPPPACNWGSVVGAPFQGASKVAVTLYQKLVNKYCYSTELKHGFSWMYDWQWRVPPFIVAPAECVKARSMLAYCSKTFAIDGHWPVSISTGGF